MSIDEGFYIHVGDAGPLNTEATGPTLALRFLDGRLQQAWEITNYQNGRIVGRRIEWRDVPNESSGSGPGRAGA